MKNENPPITQADYTPENTMELNQTPETVKEFARAAIFKATPEQQFTSCVDGRYPESEAGATAIAGADVGFLEAALAAANKLQHTTDTPLSNEAVLEAVYELAGGKEKFQYHSDDHADLNGCGHNMRATTRAQEYGLTAEQAQFILHTLQELQEQNIAPTVLTGKHEESAVFVVSTPEYNAEDPESAVFSMHHQVTQGDKTVQAFVYHQTLVTEKLHKLAEILKRQIPNPEITAENLYSLLAESEESQRMLTVKELALDKGLRAFAVHINKSGEITELTQIA